MHAITDLGSVARRVLAASLLVYCVCFALSVTFSWAGVAGPLLLFVRGAPIGLAAVVLFFVDYAKTPRPRPAYGIESTLVQVAALALIAVHGLIVMLPLLPIVGLSAYRGSCEMSAAARRSVAAFAAFIAATACIGWRDRAGPSLTPLDYALAGHAVLWLWLGLCERRAFLLRRDEAVSAATCSDDP